MGGLEPTKTILIARRMRKRIGKAKRIFLIFRRDFLSKRVLEDIIVKNLSRHNFHKFKIK
jgi:hypothetical protein